MRRLIITMEEETLADAILLTGCVQALSECCEVDVRSRFPDVWAHNPNLTPLGESGERVECVTLRVSRIGDDPAALVRSLTEQTGIDLRATELRPDIHISSEESGWCSQVHEIVRDDRPYWVVVRGSSSERESIQRSIDHFAGRVLFVEASLTNQEMPALRGSIDLRGRTSLRQFIRLIYNAQGVLSEPGPVSWLASALKRREPFHGRRPCVDIRNPSEQIIADIEAAFAQGDLEFLTGADWANARAERHHSLVRELFGVDRLLPFKGFMNRFAGETCFIVGRGPTTFDYAELGNISAPIFFLNDAVALEKYATQPTFFFAHDPEQQVWLTRGLKSTAVLPIGGKFWRQPQSLRANHNGSIVLYRWSHQGGKLLEHSRESLAQTEQLYRHSGTIHSLIHFVWFCGFRRVRFIGCDGLNNAQQLEQIGTKTGYDVRLPNESRTAPWWQYAEIKAAQDRLCARLGLEVEYIGTPPLPAVVIRASADLPIPQRAHFVWLGGPVPQMVNDNIERFRSLHPDWAVRLWIGVPHCMPDDLVAAVYSTHELCMRADIIRLWLLHEYGGVYLDGDVYTLRSFDELRRLPAFAGRRLHGTLNNAVLGAAPKSTASARLLDELRASIARCPQPRQRTAFGPDLLARLHHRAKRTVSILPAHYFYIFQTQGTAIRFLHASAEERTHMLNVVSDRVTDEQAPFAIHTWGIPKDEMPDLYGGQSSWVKPLRIGDALLRRLPNRPLVGAELGAPDTRLTAYWLGHNAGLRLWRSTDSSNSRPAEVEIGFASDRLRHCTPEEAPETSALDWVFVHAGVPAAVAARWVERLRSGGLIAHQSAEEPFCQDAEMEAGICFTAAR